jgi:hypothetical protein
VSSSAKAEELSFFFKPSYEESRALFLNNFAELKKTNPELIRHELKIPSKRHEDLISDVLYLPPASGRKERLLVLVSGIHGIEGFVGSALQNLFIQENFFGQRDENLGILIVHALNPYGFKFARRVTENNVDLNRNLDTSTDLFKIKNPGYQSIRELLNPPEQASNGFGDRLNFYFQCVKAILKYSMDTLRRAILKGQYEVPEGIYFGGQEFEPQKDLLEKELLTFTTGYPQVLLVDLHTGYGKRGQLHLFADRSPALDAEYLGKVFQGHELDYGQKKDFYEATGGMVVYAAKLLKNKTKFAGIVFEFGTLDSQKTLGSLDSLYRMVRENQWHHHGSVLESDALNIQQLFWDMFYPRDPEWRESVAKQFRDTLSLSLQNQKALK